MKPIRWAVSLTEAINSPNFENTYRKAVLCLSEDDVEIQRSYRYRQDSLASLIGKLLMRYAVSKKLKIPWKNIDFEKTSKGKPYLKTSIKTDFDFYFNISHQGDLVVFASDSNQIGVDVMKIDESRDLKAEMHINKLKRQFTDNELSFMKSYETEIQRWRSFYRFWCLKESILKATGIGLTDNLKKYEFKVDKNDEHKPGCFITSTKYFNNQIEQKNWRIEEQFIGNDHCVAVSINRKNNKTEEEHIFEIIKFEELIDSAEFINISPDFCDISELSLFLKKADKPF